MLKNSVFNSLFLAIIFSACQPGSTSDQELVETDSEVLPTKTSLVIQNERIDFGERMQGDTVELKYAVTNTGKNKLIIENVIVDCSCMSPEYNSEIPVGATDSVTIKFRTAKYAGEVKKHVVMKSNIPSKFSKLTFHGFVQQ